MKIRRYAVLTIAGALLFGACGSDEKKAETTTADTAAPVGDTTAPAGDTTAPAAGIDCKPVKAGVLSVVTSLPGPNFWGTDEADPSEIKSGIEYDMAVAIATACGLEMQVRNEPFEALTAGQIAADSYDLSLSQVTITDARKEVIDFSVPYFKSDQGLLVKAGTAIADFAALADLKVGVQVATTAEYYFLEEPSWKLNSDPQSFPDLIAAYAALNAGQVDVVVIDTPINLGQAAASDGALEVVGQISTGEEYGAIYPKGSEKGPIFDGIIQGLIDDGTVPALIAKYLGGDPGSVPFIALPAS